MAIPGSWDELPLIITAQVFGYLGNEDRFNASRVCKGWSEALYSANLWRKIELVITGRDEVEDERNVNKAKNVGAWVTDVKIICESIRARSAIFNIRRILDSLHEARLTKFELNQLNLECINNEIMKNLFSREISELINRFIGTQTWLESFSVSRCGVPVDLGLEILENLSLVSGNTLQHLDITNFFTKFLRTSMAAINGVCIRPSFRSSMSRFSQLRNVKMDYNCLDEEILLGLAQNCAGILQDLTVWCAADEPCGHSISSSTWEHVLRLCPELRVSVSISLHLDTPYAITRLFPGGMPLAALRFESTKFREASTRLVVQHLYNFTESLEELDLTLHSRYDTSSFEVIANLVISCRKLKVFAYRGNLQRGKVMDICEAQKDGRLQLQRCELRLERPDEMDVWIMAEYGPIFESQNSRFSIIS